VTVTCRFCHCSLHVSMLVSWRQSGMVAENGASFLKSLGAQRERSTPVTSPEGGLGWTCPPHDFCQAEIDTNPVSFYASDFPLDAAALERCAHLILEDDTVKYFVPISTQSPLFYSISSPSPLPSPPTPSPSTLHPQYIVTIPIRIPACLSVCCYKIRPPLIPNHFFWLCI